METHTPTHAVVMREVRRALAARDLTIVELAARCDVSPSYLSRVLTGHGGGSWGLIERMAEALGGSWGVTFLPAEGVPLSTPDHRATDLRQEARGLRKTADALDAIADTLDVR